MRRLGEVFGTEGVSVFITRSNGEPSLRRRGFIATAFKGQSQSDVGNKRQVIADIVSRLGTRRARPRLFRRPAFSVPALSCEAGNG